MPKKYYLDMGTAQFLPDWWPDDAPRLIRVVPGQYGRDWDVVMEELSEEFQALIREAASSTQPNAAKNLPIGFDKEGLDWVTGGARILEVETDD